MVAKVFIRLHSRSWSAILQGAAKRFSITDGIALVGAAEAGSALRAASSSAAQLENAV
jgi:hypothetical protein